MRLCVLFAKTTARRGKATRPVAKVWATLARGVSGWAFTQALSRAATAAKAAGVWAEITTGSGASLFEGGVQSLKLTRRGASSKTTRSWTVWMWCSRRSSR